MRTLLAFVIGISAALACTGSQTAAQEPYYKGKRLSVLVNYAPGGPTDIEGRLFARHIGRLIDGQPSVVVQNIDGAGGLIGTTYLGEIAPKDGTMVGYLTGAAGVYANDPDKHRVDLRTYDFIAYQAGTAVYYVRSDVAPGMRNATDIVQAKGLISGGLAADNSKDLLIRLTLDILSVPFRHVTGYRSNQAARLALQRNEVNFFAESPPGYRSVVEPSMTKTGMVIPLYYDPNFNGETLSVPRQVEGLPVPSFQDFYRTIKGAPPVGQLWDVYLSSLAINGAMQRLIALPPNAPPAAVEALRTAVKRLNRDKAYADDAMKVMGFVPDYEGEPDINAQVRKVLTVRPETRAFVTDYLKGGRK